MPRGPFWIAALLRFYPRLARERYGDEIATAILACARRERAAGTSRPLIAARLILDAASAGALMRRDHAPKGDPFMQSLLHDVRHSFRLLRRAPLFSVLVVATLALAIGANTAIFSVVNGVLLRPLPYAQPDRLVLLYEQIGTLPPFGFSAPDLMAFRERARSYESLAAYRNVEFELSGVDQPERITAARVSWSLMDVLGVAPALGRTFTTTEDTGREPVAILSDALWRRKFGADPSMLGRSVSLDRRAYTVVGIMPPRFSFPNRGPALNGVPADIFVPISFNDAQLRAFGAMFNNSVVGRLRPGVTLQQANGEAAAITKQIVAEVYPAELRDNGFSVAGLATSMSEEVVGNVRRILVVLLAAVGVLLLIACADIACLMLTRAASRTREMAIRTALGAGRARVMRLMLVEAAVLAAVGGACGLALAWLIKRGLLASVSDGLPRAHEIALDGRVLAFTAAAAICAAFVCGLVPAIEASRQDSSSGALKEGGRSATASIRQRRIFSTLVTLQFACAVVLLACGALLIRSFDRLISKDPGFDRGGVITASVSLPRSSYPTAATVRTFYGTLLERVSAAPGVSAAGAATDLPLTVRERRAFTIENPSPAAEAPGGAVANDWVTGQYFGALGARVMRGRALGPSDTETSEPVVVINETLAKRFYPGEDPVNRRLAWGGPKNHGPWMRIVGVIGDIKQAGLAKPTEPQTWQPWSQVADGAVANIQSFRTLNLIVRSSVPPLSLVPQIRAEVRRLDPALPVTGVQTLDDIVGASAATQRFNAMVLGGFAGAALLLAGVGIAGVLAISVSRRTSEIGIRLALGAEAGSVVRMVIRQGMTLALLGLAIGIPGAFVATRLLRSLLFETAPHDLISFVSAAAILCAVALAACALPALRASRVSPVAALRID